LVLTFQACLFLANFFNVKGVLHHEIFVKPNGQPIFLEVAKRVIGGGSVAEIFYDQFGINLREVDYKLKLKLNIGEVCPKVPEKYYACVAMISRPDNFILSENQPDIKSK
jgi:hypothetical protein